MSREFQQFFKFSIIVTNQQELFLESKHFSCFELREQLLRSNIDSNPWNQCLLFGPEKVLFLKEKKNLLFFILGKKNSKSIFCGNLILQNLLYRLNCYLCVCASASSASGGVEMKAETASSVGMKAKCKNPSEGLSNQEKNQYWTVYWWEIRGLYTKVKEGSHQKDWIKKILDLSEEGEPKWRELKCSNENAAAWLEWLTLLGRKDKQTAACLKRLWACKSEKYRRVKKRVLSVYYDSANQIQQVKR